MLMRTYPFRELAQQVMGTRILPATMPMDAYPR